MKIHLLMVTYNRLHYTRLALPRLLADPDEEFELTIWDNASSDGTREYLKEKVADPRIRQVVLSDENVGQVAAINTIWGSSDADLLGKVDNDCLVTPGWTRTLAEAHRDIEKLGVVACWHYFAADFDYERAKRKIQSFGRHRIFRHVNTCGSGLLIKRRVYEELGPLPGPATTTYWYGMGLAGYIVGFYYPLVLQEHMDDPKSSYTTIVDDESLKEAKAVTFGLKYAAVDSLAERLAVREEILRDLLEGPYDPRSAVGWRGKVSRAKRALRRLVRRAAALVR